MTSGNRWRRARSASVPRWTGLGPAVWNETIVFAHDSRGGNEAVVASPRVALCASTTVASTPRDIRTTLAYRRVSQDTQDTKTQRLAIGEFARAERVLPTSPRESRLSLASRHP